MSLIAVLGPLAVGWAMVRSLALHLLLRLILAYWSGLVVMLALVFTLSEGFGVSITPLSTGLTALFATATLWRLGRAVPAEEDDASAASVEETSEIDRGGVFAVVTAILVLAHRHAVNLFTPLSDWDAFYYHLPIAKLIRDGAFATDFGPDAIRMVASYPPLQFYCHGNSAWMFDSLIAVPRFVLLGVNLSLILLVLQLATDWGLAKRHRPWFFLGLALVVHPIPITQAFMAIYVVLAVWAIGRERLLLAGIALSGCLWTSYLGFVVTGLFSCWLVIELVKPRCLTRARAGIILAIGWGLWLPFIARNLLVMGNPLYPALLGLFGGPGVTHWTITNQSTDLVHLGLADMAKGYLFMAWSLPVVALLYGSTSKLKWLLHVLFAGMLFASFTVLLRTDTMLWRYWYPFVFLAVAAWGANLSKRELPRFAVFAFLGLFGMVAWLKWGPTTPSLIVGLLFVAIFLLGLVQWIWAPSVEISPRIRGLLVFGSLIYVVLAHTTRDDTNLIPAIPFLLILAAIGTGIALLWQRVTGRPGAIGVGALGGLGIIALIAVSQPGWRGITMYNFTVKADLLWMNEHLPQDARIVTAETRLFTLERDALAWNAAEMEAVWTSEERAQVTAALDNAKVTHMYWDKRGGAPYPWYFEPLVQQRLVRQLHTSETGTIWEVIAPAHSN